MAISDIEWGQISTLIERKLDQQRSKTRKEIVRISKICFDESKEFPEGSLEGRSLELVAKVFEEFGKGFYRDPRKPHCPYCGWSLENSSISDCPYCGSMLTDPTRDNEKGEL